MPDTGARPHGIYRFIWITRHVEVIIVGHPRAFWHSRRLSLFQETIKDKVLKYSDKEREETVTMWWLSTCQLVSESRNAQHWKILATNTPKSLKNLLGQSAINVPSIKHNNMSKMIVRLIIWLSHGILRMCHKTMGDTRPFIYLDEAREECSMAFFWWPGVRSGPKNAKRTVSISNSWDKIAALVAAVELKTMIQWK